MFFDLRKAAELVINAFETYKKSCLKNVTPLGLDLAISMLTKNVPVGIQDKTIQPLSQVLVREIFKSTS